MRTIGQKNITLVKRVTRQVLKETDLSEVIETVRDRLPSKLWDIWEGSDSEINRIIYDVIMEKRRPDDFNWI